ncbi:hypothetical protein, partial [Pseudomonas aeruginosa]|uniref:hypothetical protein n=1 Tax=Pseudomonas aeruginosa TaxID=287 RepID=UPI001F036B49
TLDKIGKARRRRSEPRSCAELTNPASLPALVARPRAKSRPAPGAASMPHQLTSISQSPLTTPDHQTKILTFRSSCLNIIKHRLGPTLLSKRG